MLHIVAHSVYKAHAFLSCGSVLESAERLRTDSSPIPMLPRRLITLPIAIVVVFGLCCGPVWLLGSSHETESGNAILGLVLAVALTQMVWNGLSTGSWRLAVQSVLAGSLVIVSYYSAFLVMDSLIGNSVPHDTTSPSLLDTVVLGMVGFGFISICLLQAVIDPLSHLPLMRALFVHAMNGFYLDIPARRLTALCWRQSAPVQ